MSTSRCIAYSIKVNAPRNYIVKPNKGVIDRSSKVVVDLTHFPSDQNEIINNKFLVCVAMTDLTVDEVRSFFFSQKLTTFAGVHGQ